MKARLYIKPNVIGLQFETPHLRDLFLLSLKHKKVDACAEPFGERTVRFNPSKATTIMDIAVDVETNGSGIVRVYVEEKNGTAKEKPVPVMTSAPKPIEQGIKASDIRPPAPMNPLGTLPPEVTGVTPVVTEVPIAVSATPPQIEVPEIAQISHADDPKPVGVHHLSKEMREWKARQKANQAV